MKPDSACPDDAATRAKIAAFWNRKHDLSLAIMQADKAPPERRARNLERLRQSTSRFINEAEQELPERFPDESLERQYVPDLLAGSHQLRAWVYFCLGQREKCFADHERALEYDSTSDLHLYENYVDACIKLGEPLRAAEIANRAPFELWRSEEYSVAGRVLRWAQENPAFAAAVRPEVMEECQRLVAFGAGSSQLSAQAWSDYTTEGKGERS